MWVEDRKIASIGVHLSSGVSAHGFAVNVDNDVEPFHQVVACGLPGVRMTSVALETGRRGPAARFRNAHGGRLRRAPTAAAPGMVTPGGAGARAARYPPWREHRPAAPPRHPLAREPRRDGRREGAGTDVQPFRSRKPAWFKVPPPGGASYRELSRMIRDENLHTVCQEAACPNVGDCWERGTATFMILGDTCTRRCGFCNVKTGKPTWNDPLEPLRVARSVAKMGLRHAVIT